MAGQVWATDSLGGYMFSKNLSKVLRTQAQAMSKFRQFADLKDASMQGKSKGNTYTWNTYSNLTTRGGTLSETAAMPTSDFTITQGTLTITEFGKLLAALFSSKFNLFCSVCFGQPMAYAA